MKPYRVLIAGSRDWIPVCRFTPDLGEPPMTTPPTEAAPHPWTPQRWRFWLCRHCYAPRQFHPRTGWVLARPVHDNRYLGPNAPHFTEGW